MVLPWPGSYSEETQPPPPTYGTERPFRFPMWDPRADEPFFLGTGFPAGRGFSLGKRTSLLGSPSSVQVVLEWFFSHT